MTVGLPHDVVLATVRDFTDRCGAQRVTVVLDRGDGSAPPVIECEPGEPIAVTSGDDDVVVMQSEYAAAEPVAFSLPKPIPATAITADPVKAEVSAPIGALQAFADALSDLAGALGGRTVAVAELGTRDGMPLTVAARPGEAVVLAIGEQQFELGTHT